MALRPATAISNSYNNNHNHSHRNNSRLSSFMSRMVVNYKIFLLQWKNKIKIIQILHKKKTKKVVQNPLLKIAKVKMVFKTKLNYPLSIHHKKCNSSILLHNSIIQRTKCIPIHKLKVKVKSKINLGVTISK